MSAVPPLTDIGVHMRDVGEVPFATKVRCSKRHLFDHLVSAARVPISSGPQGRRGATMEQLRSEQLRIEGSVLQQFVFSTALTCYEMHAPSGDWTCNRAMSF